MTNSLDERTIILLTVGRKNCLFSTSTKGAEASAVVFIPFRAQEVMDKGGIWFGQNAITNNLILCNKEKLMNPNAFQLGVPGSGKSFLTKEQIIFIALATKDDIIICVPEAEVRQEVA